MENEPRQGHPHRRRGGNGDGRAVVAEFRSALGLDHLRHELFQPARLSVVKHTLAGRRGVDFHLRGMGA